MLDLMADIYTKVWEFYLKELYHPLVDVIKDIFAHNRLSRNLVDPKMKSVIEYFSNVVPAVSYSIRKYHHHQQQQQQQHLNQTGEVSGVVSTNQSRPSTPRRENNIPTTPAISTSLRPSTTGSPTQNNNFSPKRLLLHLAPPPLADYPTANTHFFLFGRILGVLPSPQSQIRPSLIYIVTMVLVMAVCEK